MATTIAKLNNGVFPIATLDTFNYTALTTAIHEVKVTVRCSNPMTGISITIKQNGSTVVSISEPPTTVNELNCIALVSVTATDSMSFIIASTNAVDSNPNSIHGTIRFVVSNVPC